MLAALQDYISLSSLALSAPGAGGSSRSLLIDTVMEDERFPEESAAGLKEAVVLHPWASDLILTPVL